MKKWRRTIFWVVLIPALLYGSVRGYVWFTIKDKVDDLQRAMAPVARLEYREIASSLLDPVGVKGIVITPIAVNDRIQIGSVLIHSKDLLQHLQLVQALLQKRVPAELKVSANRISIALDGEIASFLDRFQTANWVGTPLDTMGCGTKTLFTTEDLRRMGYERLSNDVTMEYHRDPVTEALVLSIRTRAQDFYQVNIEAALPASEIPASTKQLKPVIPKIEYVSVTVADEGYNKRKNTFCADLIGSNVDQFVETHIQKVLEFAETHDFNPSEDLINGYREFLTKPAKLTVGIRPFEPLLATAIQAPTSNETMTTLGVEVHVSGKPIKDLGRFGPSPEELAKLEEKQEKKPQVMPDTYKPTPIEELSLHINRIAIAHMKDGKSHRGFLTTVGAKELILTRHEVGGSAIITVTVSDIESVDVLR